MFFTNSIYIDIIILVVVILQASNTIQIFIICLKNGYRFSFLDLFLDPLKMNRYFDDIREKEPSLELMKKYNNLYFNFFRLFLLLGLIIILVVILSFYDVIELKFGHK